MTRVTLEDNDYLNVEVIGSLDHCQAYLGLL